MNRFYGFLSAVLSPPAFALYMVIVLSVLSPYGLGTLDAFSSIAIGMVFLVLIPLTSIYYFSSDDIDVIKKEKRVKIYLVVIVSYLASSSIFWILNSHIMFVISLSYVFVTCAIAAINIFWKVSAHTAGVAGPTTALIYVFGPSLVPIYILTILAFVVRLKMKVHNVLQLVVGAIVAIFITSMVYNILW